MKNSQKWLYSWKNTRIITFVNVSVKRKVILHVTEMFLMCSIIQKYGYVLYAIKCYTSMANNKIKHF